MKGLAWDDRPGSGMERLRDALHRISDGSMDLHVFSNQEDFALALSKRSYDYYVVDMFEGAQSSDPEASIHKESTIPSGVGIIENLLTIPQVATGERPVYVYSNDPNGSYEQVKRFRQGIVVKDKKARVIWTAREILQDLKNRGVFVDKSRCFLVFANHERTRAEELEKYLIAGGFTVDKIDAGNVTRGLLTEITQRMNSSGAIIAVCTADDHWRRDNTAHPRQNVVLEIGMAVGLARGPERLIILQQSNPSSVEETSQIPSDIRELLTLQFISDISEKHEELLMKLEAIGCESKKAIGKND